jgi:hypothetical protein
MEVRELPLTPARVWGMIAGEDDGADIGEIRRERHQVVGKRGMDELGVRQGSATSISIDAVA